MRVNRRLRLLATLALGIGLIVIWFLIVDLGKMVHFFKQVKVSFMLASGLLLFLTYFAKSLRWRIVISFIERLTIVESFNMCIAARFINYVIPLRSGELVQSLFLKRERGTPISKSLPIIFVDKAIDLFALFIILLGTFALVVPPTQVIYLVLRLLVLVLFLLFMGLTLFILKKSIAFKAAIKILSYLPNRVGERLLILLGHFLEGLSVIEYLPGRILSIAALTILALLFDSFCLWVFFYAFGIEMPLWQVLSGYALLHLLFALPAPPGVVGSLELSYILVFALTLGYDKNLIGAVAASAHIFSTIFLSALGFLSLTFLGIKIGSLLDFVRRGSQSKGDDER